MALAALAMSAGFAADRLLLTEPDTQLVFQEHPTSRSGAGAPASFGATDPLSSPAAEPTPPLKPIHRPTTSTPPSNAPSAASRGGSAASRISAEDAVARLTNRERVKVGCGPLRIDGRLRTAARRHSADMAARKYFGHISPSGDTFVDRLKAAGYLTPGAENIAKGYQSDSAVVAGWMRSPGHRANILNCNLHAIGVGVHFGPGGPWWTQDFGWD